MRGLWLVLLLAAPVGAAEFCGKIWQTPKKSQTVLDNKHFPWITAKTSWKAVTPREQIKGCYCVTGTLGKKQAQNELTWLAEVTTVKPHKNCATPNMRALVAPSITNLKTGVQALGHAVGGKKL